MKKRVRLWLIAFAIGAIATAFIVSRLDRMITVSEVQITKDYQAIGREGWHEQFRMMSQKRKQIGSLAQIQEIGTVGEPFNYKLHDIIISSGTGTHSN